MKKLTEIAIKRPLLICVVFIILILFGVIGYSKLSYNLLPKFDANVISVVTTYRGASAEEIENTVTKKIEEAISALEGIDKISASSQEGVSIVIIQLLNGTDVNKAQNDAQRKVDQIVPTLPKDIDQPVANKFSTDDMPVLTMGVTANIDARELYDIIDLQVKPQLANVPGVGQVNLVGGSEREIKINVNKDKLQAYNLTISQVAAMVGSSSLSTPAGKIQTNQTYYSIKYDAKFNNTEQLRNMILLQNPNGSKIYLKDIAEVIDGEVEATTINHIDGIPSIGVQVFKQTDANAVEVSKLIRKRLDVLTNTYQDIHMKFDLSSDQSKYTLDSANAVMHDLLLAVAIVAFVMLMFLHSFRSSMFVLVALPCSMIPTFALMYVFGMSLNLMTLMALSLIVGILVDDSIVILENIMRHMEMGKNKRHAAIDGRSEIGFTAMAITMVDVVVFLPLALTGGMIGNIVREFALVVVCSTLMSLLVCFTITPVLASRYGRLEHLNPKTLWGKLNIWFENMLGGAKDGYSSLLKWALRHKRWILGGALALLIGSFMLVSKGFVGAAFMAPSDRGELMIKLELEPQSPLYKTNQVTQEVEKILMTQPEVIKVASSVGSSGSMLATTSNTNMTSINVTLVDKKDRKISTDEFGMRMKDVISKIAGVKVTISPVGITGNASQADIQLAVKSNNRDSMRFVANQIREIVKSIPGTYYVEFSAKDPKPQVEIKLDRTKMADFGLNAAEVGTAISNNFRGNDNTKYKYEGNEYDIMVQADDFDKSNINDVRALTFVNSAGQSFQLSQFANINENLGESVLERLNRLPSITINASVIGRPAGTVSQEITEKVNSTIKLPDGVNWQYVGSIESMADSFLSLFAALGLGILLIYLIMVALYENVVYPLVVMFALPLAMIGALLALALTMESLTIFAMLGLIMLMGLVAKNAILIVDFANHRKAEGAHVVDALIEAGRERFRPILMTTLAMISGMLPIALASGAGAEVKNGMAWVIIGGLTSSLLLTLVVVPCVYYIVDKLIIAVTKKRRIRFIYKTRKRINNKWELDPGYVIAEK